MSGNGFGFSGAVCAFFILYLVRSIVHDHLLFAVSDAVHDIDPNVLTVKETILPLSNVLMVTPFC
ncbi:hypothetical protein KA405_01880 [Patescibacteria group bacterium]|nr:hypothetical protein [Patescibacteria group bacterium]